MKYFVLIDFFFLLQRWCVQFILIIFFFFSSKPRGGPEWTPIVGGTFKLVQQPKLILARTGSAHKE